MGANTVIGRREADTNLMVGAPTVDLLPQLLRARFTGRHQRGLAARTGSAVDLAGPSAHAPALVPAAGRPRGRRARRLPGLTLNTGGRCGRAQPASPTEARLPWLRSAGIARCGRACSAARFPQGAKDKWPWRAWLMALRTLALPWRSWCCHDFWRASRRRYGARLVWRWACLSLVCGCCRLRHTSG